MKNLLIEEKIIKLPNEGFEKRGKDFLETNKGKSFNVEVEGMIYHHVVLTDVIYIGLEMNGNEEELRVKPVYGLSFTGGVNVITPMLVKMTPVLSKEDKHYNDIANGCEKQFRANSEASMGISENVNTIINKCMDKFNELRAKFLGKRVKLILVYGIEFEGVITDMKIDRVVDGTCIIEYKINDKETIKSDKIDGIKVLG